MKGLGHKLEYDENAATQERLKQLFSIMQDLHQEVVFLADEMNSESLEEAGYIIESDVNMMHDCVLNNQ